MHPRIITLAATLSALALLSACAGGGQAPLTPGAPAAGSATTLGAILMHEGLSESALGIFSLALDPSSLTATTALAAQRTLSANDDLYALDISNFLRPDSFRVTTITQDADTVRLAYEVAHPFPAPADPAGTPNGFTNRSDLGIAGRVLFLADSPAPSTFFTDVRAETGIVTEAAGYYRPAGLLNLTTTANAFPYNELVDESGTTGARVGISNGGDPTGNFGADGWTRSEYGIGNAGWTGYGVLHQGQVAANTLVLNKTALLSGGPFTLDVAILAKYNDPRGGVSSIEKRGNRLPPASPDATKFAYRMPHGALDVSRIEFLGESGGFQANDLSASTLSFRLTDFDARATETLAADLSEDPDVTTVAIGESGIPAFAISIPGVLGDVTVTDEWDPGTTLLDDDTAFGGDPEVDSGRPGDTLFWQKAVTKPAATGQSEGDYVGLARAIDPEPQTLVTALDGTTLQPLTANLPAAVTYQTFTVMLGGVANFPPEFAGPIGLKLQNPCMPSPASFTIENKDLVFTDPEGDPVTFTVVATPDVGSPIELSGIPAFPITNAATGPFSTPVSQVTFEIYANDAAHPGTSGTLLPVITAPAPLVGTVSVPNPWAVTWGASSAQAYDVAVSSTGEIYVAGYFQGNADLDPGPGTDSKIGFGNWDAFVSKFDANGIYQWGRHWGGSGQDYASAVAVDSSGNCYVAGRFEGLNIDFDPTAGVDLKSSTGSYDAFTIALSPTGTYLWSATWGGAGVDWAFDIGVDLNGNPTMVGRCSGTVDFDPGPGVQNMTGPGGDDSFLLRLNPTGTYNTAYVTGNSFSDNYHALAFDGSGGLFVSGTFQLTMDLDPGPGVQNRTSSFAGQTYILKLNASDLSFQWVAHLEVQVPLGSTHYGMATDPFGDVYFTAAYAFSPVGDLDAGPGTAIVPALMGTQDAFLVAYTGAGDYKWFSVVQGNGTAGDWGHEVAANEHSVFWVGAFAGTNIDFDQGPGTFEMSTPTGSSNAFIASFDRIYGCFQGAGQIGGNTTDIAYGVDMANECDPIFSGTVQGSVDFDPGPGTQTRPGVGSFTAYLDKLNGGTLAF